MTTTAAGTLTDTSTTAPPPPRETRPVERIVTHLLQVRLSGIYGLIALIALFSLLYPDTFLTAITLRTTLGDQSITGILAIGSLVPLVAGMFDLSFGSVAAFGLITVSWLSTHMHAPDLVLLLLTLAACACFGLSSSFLVTYLGVDSLIVTLGMGTVALGLAEKISGNNTLTPKLGGLLTRLGSGTMLGLPMTFVVLVVLAALVLLWLEYTPGGRYTLAAGDNPVAAKLAGVRVARAQAGTLVFSSVIAGLAGVLLAAKIGQATTVTTTGYLLPVVAGLMLGATQIKGRPNVLGTIIAIYLIGVGLKGLQLGGAEIWVNDVFNGGVLLGALALSAYKRIR